MTPMVERQDQQDARATTELSARWRWIFSCRNARAPINTLSFTSVTVMNSKVQ